MRLYELTPDQIEAWRQARMKEGRRKYGDSHLRRYGLVDVMEELLDAKNILALIDDRLSKTGTWGSDISGRLAEVQMAIDLAIRQAMQTDRIMRDDQCTDEAGGHRIWWSEQCGCVEARLMAQDQNLPRLVKGYRLLAEAVEAEHALREHQAQCFWAQADHPGCCRDQSCMRLEEARDKAYEAALDHLRGVGRD